MILWSDKKIIDKEIIDQGIIDSMISYLKSSSIKYPDTSREDFSYYTSYNSSLKISNRKLDLYYDGIVSDVCKDLTLYNRGIFSNYYWIQVYPQNGGSIGIHHHHKENGVFSWVHFIKPSSKKCFYFINHEGQRIYPEEQNEGDFIVFPSWAAHAADPNQDKDDRIIIAGNVFTSAMLSTIADNFDISNITNKITHY